MCHAYKNGTVENFCIHLSHQLWVMCLEQSLHLKIYLVPETVSLVTDLIWALGLLGYESALKSHSWVTRKGKID